MVVKQFVEQTSCLLVFTHSEQRTGHQFLEVVAVIVRQPRHPLVGFLAYVVVLIEVAHVLDEVVHLVGIQLGVELAQVFVGLVYASPRNQYLGHQIVVVGSLLVADAVGILAGRVIVGIE